MAPTLVQSKSGTGTSVTNITVTLTSSTAAGNCLVVCAAGVAGAAPSISSVTLGGATDNFALAKKQAVVSFSDGDCEIWTDQNCAGGQTAVKVTFSASQTDILVWVMEWSGISASGAVDKTNGGNSTSSSWSSGSSGTLTNANEVVIGASLAASVAGTASESGPASPWSNLAVITAGSAAFIAGSQIVTATTAQTYSGTASGGNGVFETAAVIITLTEAAATPEMLLIGGFPV